MKKKNNNNFYKKKVKTIYNNNLNNSIDNNQNLGTINIINPLHRKLAVVYRVTNRFGVPIGHPLPHNLVIIFNSKRKQNEKNFSKFSRITK